MTVMPVDQLVTTLAGARVGGTLPFTGALIGDPGITALLVPLFDAGTASIAGAEVTKSGDGTSAVVSGTLTMGKAACAAALTLTPGTDSTALLLTLTPAAGWGFQSVFPGAIDPAFSAVTMASGGLVVVSAPQPPPGGGPDVPRGMSVVAEIDVAKSYPLLTVLLGGDPVPVRGAVADPGLPLMALSTDPRPAKLGGTSLGAFTIALDFTNIAELGSAPIGLGVASARASFALGGGSSGTATMTFPSGGSLLSLAVAFEDVTLGNFALLEPFIGSADPLAALPQELRDEFQKAGSHFLLQSLGLTFDTAAVAFPSASVEVMVTLDGFKPFPPIDSLTIDDVAIAWAVHQGATTTTSFSATADLHLTPTCPVSVGIQTQPDTGYVVIVREGDGAVLKVSDVVAALIPGLDLPELAVEGFVVTLTPRQQSYALQMTIEGSWPVLEELGIELATVAIDASYLGWATPKLSGTIDGTLTFDIPASSAVIAGARSDDDPPSPGPPTVDLDLVAQRPAGSSDWLLIGKIADGESVPVGDLLAALLARLKVSASLPAPLAGMTVERLALQLDQSSEAFDFGCAMNFPVGAETLEATVAIGIAGKGNQRQLNFGGSLQMGGLAFDLSFEHGGGRDVLFAEFEARGAAGTIDVKQTIASVLPELASALPDGLVIDIADAAVALIAGAADGGRKFVFAMDISVEFPLSDLPLIGPAVPADAKAGIKDLRIVIASEALTADDVAAVNACASSPVLPAPPAGATGDAVPKGVSMAATLELGPLQIALASPAPARPRPAGRALAAVSGDTDSVSWVNVQKSLGPVTIEKVGFSYKDGALFVLSNIDIAVAGLTIELIGIGIGSPITNPSPHFTIQGLGVSYNQGPVSVTGGMLGTLDPVDFTGILSVKVPEFSLAALAGYTSFEDHPSFFLYGVLDAPIGGPPAFFVTGIAAGMGFNRRLLVPDVANVPSFPLVQWAQGVGAPASDPTKPIGDQVTAALTLLGDTVAPSVGDYWVAFGLRFTSFELVDSFALVTLSVGADVEIAILGVSTATIPPDDPAPVAEIQLAIEVSFSWNEGLIAIAGQLTNNSYVLSRDCRLTGGFAFYLWVKGDDAGETVLSVGGYNPHFTIPQRYPQVPRLGLNWQVVPELNINGALYFAVTPNVVMAGGKMSAVWNSGPISAWFTYWADFMMTFQPFHYYVDGGIDLGASFTIDLLLFSVSITIHVGVDLSLWGPPFAGRAVVDLDIISFTITFNDHDANTSTSVDWNQFVTQLLPAAGKPTAAARRRALRAPEADPAPAPTPAILQINVAGGLVKTLPADGDTPQYLVNAETFTCAVIFVIPVKSATFEADPQVPGFANLLWAPDSMQPVDGSGTVIVPAGWLGADGKPIDPSTDFGVGPANIAAADFKPALTLSLAAGADQRSKLLAVRQLTNAPKALWEQKSFDANGVPQVDPAKALTESSVANALIGLKLIPKVDPPDFTRPIPLEALLFTLDGVEPFAWSTGAAPASDPFASETVAGTIAAAGPTRVRSAMVGALAGQGVILDSAIDVSRLANPAGNELSETPRLRLLGEQKGAAA